MMKSFLHICAGIIILLSACKKKDNPAPPPPAGPFNIVQLQVPGTVSGTEYRDFPVRPVIKIIFSAKVERSTVTPNILFTESSGLFVPYNVGYERNDSVVVIQPSGTLKYLSQYTFRIFPDIQSTQQKKLGTTTELAFFTTIDSSRKFPPLSDDALLTLVQRQHFKYFWDFAHPVSGLARERNTSGDLVTSGGSGFGIMAIVTGIHRQFITRAEGLARMQKIVDFLKTKAQTFHGAFPHWLNGVNGTVIPFSTKDNGADLVETSYLMQGLLTARQYFNGPDAAE
ncbi:MAG TPA: Ig-like domain-containing protein, partial [Chitinophagaceae bacterium]